MNGKADKNSERLDLLKKSAGGGALDSRRRALKVLVAGGALGSASLLPERWLKPVVEAVVLPAHAVLSIPEIATYTALAAVGIQVTQNDNANKDSLAKMVDSLIPEASAAIGDPRGNAGYYVCAVVDNPGGTAQVTVAGMGGSGGPGGGVPDNQVKVKRRGTLKLNGDEGTITAADGDWATTCLSGTPGELTRPAKIVGYTPGDTTLRVWIYGDFWVEIIADLSENGCLAEPSLGTCVA
jgi:hypothetical protein